MSEFIVFIFTFAASYAGVEMYRRWSSKKGIIDHPNERSSHSDPTPRGGGLVIAGICLIGYLLIGIQGSVFELGYLVGALIVLFISWLDDVYSVSPLLRLVCHFAAAAAVVYGAGYFQSVSIPGFSEPLYIGVIGFGLTVLWIVWLLNAYNFMDGIDGLAGLQAVLAGLAWSAAGFYGAVGTVHIYGLIIAAASLGFLIHNWQPARIFMGDTGSAFLGFTFGSLPVIAGRENRINAGIFALVGIAVVWFFVFDAAFTFILRLLKRQKVWVAHREHLYQRLVIAGKTHAAVAILYGVMTALVIVVFALAIVFGGKSTVFAIFISLVLSGWLVFYGMRKKLLT